LTIFTKAQQYSRSRARFKGSVDGRCWWIHDPRTQRIIQNHNWWKV